MTDQAGTLLLWIRAARARGLTLDQARAEALRPPVESLGARLAGLAEILPPGATPPPETGVRSLEPR